MQQRQAFDTVDQMCSTYNVARKTNRWPMVVFYSMLNVADINAQIIFQSNNKTENRQRSHFLKNLARDLSDDYLRVRSQCSSLPVTLKRDISNLHGNTNEPQLLPTQDVPSTKRKRCFKCGRSKNRATKYTCRSCGQYICLEHAQQICSDC